jgi:hypothetical protein
MNLLCTAPRPPVSLRIPTLLQLNNAVGWEGEGGLYLTQTIQPFAQNNLEINSDMKSEQDTPPVHKKKFRKPTFLAPLSELAPISPSLAYSARIPSILPSLIAFLLSV